MPISSLVLYATAAGFVVFGIALVMLSLAVVRLREASRRDAQRLFEQMDLTLGELRTVSDGLTASLQSIAELRAKVDETRRLPTAGPATSRSYDIALRLARNGASREELMSNCGMTRHEAELAVRLHGPQKRQEAPRIAAVQ